MASSQLFFIFSILAIFVPLIVAKDYVVGDKAGWTIEVDYEAWAKGKKFSVGDRLLFLYPKGSHSVVEVEEKDFNRCKAPADGKELTSGEDVIKLDAPGKKYFICNVGRHCQMGNQKVAINVESSSSSSSSTPSPSPSESSPSASSPEPSSPSNSSPPASPSPAAPSPSTSGATIGERYGWMLIMVGIIGSLVGSG
ncbi:putative Blue (type 1) copper binding protein [Rosa chinensis]|uniref:Putative Blue (Type 1) copper binding protein n=1 Tax=Rosa chinensis TaxID=74649 RepID=A0A2P6P7N8_ROSCH|nr:blue copper protein 1b-like [Rosa chinensis]PRQ17934.1 putative Blue (type 1) copper binding protein [Rosa chinensis]